MSVPSRDDHAAPWRNLAFVSIAEAAVIAGRSYTWARDRAVDGTLEVRRPLRGRTFITVASLAAIVDNEPARRLAPDRVKAAPHLALVIDNANSVRSPRRAWGDKAIGRAHV